jgi:hypothetical protein
MPIKMEARIVANNEKIEVRWSTLVSQMHIHQARAETFQEEIITKMDTGQERMGASMNAYQNKLKARWEVMEAYPG